VHEKLHECRHCLKRFNRPSTLRIHANTHTGARPFQCPFPDCGREFNVNSNMRRHYRNHARSGVSESHGALSKNIQVRMRKMSGSTSPEGRPTLSPSDDGRQRLVSSSPSTSSSHLSSSECSDEMIFEMENYDHLSEEEPDKQLLSIQQVEQCPRGRDIEDEDISYLSPSSFLTLSCSPIPPNLQRDDHGQIFSHDCDYTQSNTRTLPRSSSSLLTSGSAKQTPGRMYSSSSPVYARSCTDLKVSTVLRPAFNPAS